MYHVGTMNVLPKNLYSAKKNINIIIYIFSTDFYFIKVSLVRRIKVMFGLIKYPENVSCR